MKYLADMHTHTLASGHAYNTILEMAKAASDKGLELLGITEHAIRMPGTCDEMYFRNFKAIDREVFQVELALGVELNIIGYEGEVDMPEELLETMDIAIASFHTPCIQPGTMEQNTNAVIQLTRNPLVNIIGHPDDSTYPLDYESVVKAAAENATLLEINNSSVSPQGFRKNAAINDATMLKLCKKYEAPIVIGSDAHWMNKVGDHQYVQKIIEEVNFPQELIYNYYPDRIRPYLNKYRGCVQKKGGK